MAAGRCRLLAVLALLILPVTAVAQVIPPGAQPGREREQIRRTAGAARSAGRRRRSPSPRRSPRPALTSIRLTDQPGRHHRRDRLQRCRLRPALRRPDRRRSLARCGLRPRPPHHGQIRRGRLCAVARHRAAAEFRPARRGGAHPGGRGLCRQRGVAGETDALQGLLHRLRQPHRRRPAGQHPHARALSAAGERSAGPEVHHHAEAVADQSQRLDADRRGDREADRRGRAHRQSRHDGARAVAVSRLRHAQ